jgi:hypothetical protein
MFDVSKVKAGAKLKYIGKNFIAYAGEYTTYAAESTYKNPDSCPENEKGKLVIIEFMNNGTPMFFTIDNLRQEEWELVE